MSTISAITTHFVTGIHSAASDDGSISSWSSLIGIVTAIVGNILISFALNIQRYAHVRIDKESHDEKQKPTPAKGLPKSVRGYGTAVQQEQVAEERARLNANAPGPGHTVDGNENHNDTDETTPLQRSANSGSTTRPQDKDEHDTDEEGQHSRKSYLRSPYWWLGITLMATGEAGNFLAYGFAPASIVSPLGVVALISNCLIAPLMLKEHFRKRDFWGVLVAIGGAVTIVLSAKTSEEKMGPEKLWHTIKRWEFLAYVCITLVFIAVLMVASPRYGRRTILIDVGLVGLFGGYTALSTKGVAAMLSDTLFRAFTFPITYVLVLILILSAIMQIRYINRALSNFNSTQVIPTQFVLFTLSVIVGSAVLYRDFEKTDLNHIIRFVVGCALTFSGVWLITSGRKNGEDDDDEDEEDGNNEEAIRLIDEEAISERRQSFAKREGSNNTEANGVAAIYNSNKVGSISGSSTGPTLLTSTDTLAQHRSLSTSAVQTHQQLRPQTPSRTSLQIPNAENTPFFTPASGSRESSSKLQSLNRSESSPAATPVTPVRTRQQSLPEPDVVLPDGRVVETPPSGIFRSARGSIQRLVPGPLLQPLSGSLSAIVADSILRGEGSPRHIRDSLRRQRSSRGRHQVTTLGSFDAHGQVPGETPPLSRWATREDDAETPYSATVDVDDDEDTGRQKTRRSRLGSLSDTLGGYLKRARRKSSDMERNDDHDHERHEQ